MTKSRVDVLFGVTIPLSARVFLRHQLALLADKLSAVHLVYGDDGTGAVTDLDARVTQHAVPVVRQPSPLRDVWGLFAMLRLMQQLRPKAVVMATPKMGLLGLLAATMTRVNRRIYVLYGLRLEGASGIGRTFLIWMERLAMACATEVIVLSESNKREVQRLRLTRANKISTIGSGSIAGVDLNRFQPVSTDKKAAAKSRFGIPSEVTVVGFLGRLTADKGLKEMALLWERLHPRFPNAWLLLVGPDEASSMGQGRLLTNLAQLPRVRIHGQVDDSETVFAAMDVHLLLTKREGFGVVLLEGAACGVPVVASKVSGTVDAVIDGVTGALVPLENVEEASFAVEKYLKDSELRRQHGLAGLTRVRDEFSADRVNALWAAHIAQVVESVR